jgi:hypothetical protein
MESSYEDKLLVRNAYVQAIRERWHPDPECSILREDFDKDVHVGGEAPGNWAPRSLVEIYCEDGIPNASDINDWSDFGGGVTYNSEAWFDIDKRVREILAEKGRTDIQPYTEAHNSAVLAVYE